MRIYRIAIATLTLFCLGVAASSAGAQAPPQLPPDPSLKEPDKPPVLAAEYIGLPKKVRDGGTLRRFKLSVGARNQVVRNVKVTITIKWTARSGTARQRIFPFTNYRIIDPDTADVWFHAGPMRVSAKPGSLLRVIAQITAGNANPEVRRRALIVKR